MPVRFGTQTATLKIGETDGAGWLGLKAATFSLPGAPDITTSGGALTPFGSVILEFFPPEDDGGTPITAYRIYIDGTLQPTQEYLTQLSISGETPPYWVLEITEGGSPLDENFIEIAAVNAVGEGPKDSVTLNPAP
jgi:hypothetical protein